MNTETLPAWGYELQLDIHDCNAEAIRSAEVIREFTITLCDAIEMTRFGEPMIVHFGEDERVAGYSLIATASRIMSQLIETSCVSAHFRNENNRVYLNVFSCKAYDADVAAEVALRFFGGHVKQRVLLARD